MFSMLGRVAVVTRHFHFDARLWQLGLEMRRYGHVLEAKLDHTPAAELKERFLAVGMG